MRILGIDHGGRRVGLATATLEGRIATPWMTLRVRGRDEALRKLTDLIRDGAFGLVVVGLPVSADGREGASAARVRRFGQVLARQTGVRVLFQDEYGSTVAAIERLASGGSRRQVDEAAAAVILQEHLDSEQPNP